MEQALQKYEGHLVNIEEGAMSLDALQNQINLIQRAMEKNMKDNEHYGTIPGTNKPTLLKPGAEKLCLIFRLNPDYDIIEKVREKGFIAYTVKCSLTHIHTGTHIASGIGSCNSRETKYRYRTQNTGKPVPKDYWEDRNPAKLGGPQYTARKKDKQWMIFEQIENDNPWDLDNTIIKMACKRALVAATLNATAASDIFTQDVEDMPTEIINGDSAPTATAQPEPKPSAPKSEQPMSDAQRKKLYVMMKKEKELTDAEAKRFFEWYSTNKAEMVDDKISLKSASSFIENFDILFDEFTQQPIEGEGEPWE